MRYVDGFVLPVPKKHLQAYRRIAQRAGRVWRDHGALEYRECVGDDLNVKMGVSFPRSVKLKAGETVAFSWTDQLTPAQNAASDDLGTGIFDSYGWGFGVAIVTRRDGAAAVPGQFGWDGGLGTSWRTDPKEEMVGILMTQRAWESPNPPPVTLDFWTSAYQAIDD